MKPKKRRKKVTAFGVLLAFQRTRRCISQGMLAERVNIPASYISVMENGRRIPRSEKLLLKVAEALDLSPYETNQLLVVAGHKIKGFKTPEEEQFAVLYGKVVFLRTRRKPNSIKK